jgi:hypothetical protein
MALLIEAPETIRLIEVLARRTGEGTETAIAVAVRERLARLCTPEEEAVRRARVYALVESIQASVKASGVPVADADELLYGEDGSPR